MSEEVGKDTSELVSNSWSNNSLKTRLQSKGCEIKGKNGANYQRHGSFCINSLGLPAEDIGVGCPMKKKIPSPSLSLNLCPFRRTFKIIFSFLVAITSIESYINLESPSTNDFLD